MLRAFQFMFSTIHQRATRSGQSRAVSRALAPSATRQLIQGEIFSSDRRTTDMCAKPFRHGGTGRSAGGELPSALSAENRQAAAVKLKFALVARFRGGSAAACIVDFRNMDFWRERPSRCRKEIGHAAIGQGLTA